MLDLDRERLAAWGAVATLSGLHRAFAAIVTAREPDAIVAHTLAAASDVLGFERAAYFTHSGNASRRGVDARLELLAYVDAAAAAPPELACSAAICTLDAPLSGDAGDLCAPVPDPREWYALAPVRCAKSRFGLLFLDGPGRGVPLAARLGLVEDLCAIAAAALQNGIVFQRTRSLASRDPLTGLLNRRSFRERFERELATAKRGGRQCACVMLDLDDLKRINDSGCARRRRRRAQTSRRDVGRQCAAVGSRGAIRGRRVCARIRRCRCGLGAHARAQTLGLALGCGLTLLDRRAISGPTGDDADTLLARADSALYAVKGAGKNGFAFAD